MKLPDCATPADTVTLFATFFDPFRNADFCGHLLGAHSEFPAVFIVIRSDGQTIAVSESNIRIVHSVGIN